MKTAPNTVDCLISDIKANGAIKKFIFTYKCKVVGKDIVDLTKYGVVNPENLSPGNKYNEISRRIYDFIKNNEKTKQKINVGGLMYYYCPLNKGDIARLFSKLGDILNNRDNLGDNYFGGYLTKELEQADGVLVRQMKGLYDMDESNISYEAIQTV